MARHNPLTHVVNDTTFIEIFPPYETPGDVSFVCTECGHVFVFSALDFHTREDVFYLHNSEHKANMPFFADQMGRTHPSKETLMDTLARRQEEHKHVMAENKLFVDPKTYSKEYTQGLMAAFSKIIDKLGIEQFYEMFKSELGIEQEIDWEALGRVMADGVRKNMREESLLRKIMQPEFIDVPSNKPADPSYLSQISNRIYESLGVPKDFILATGRQMGKSQAIGRLEDFTFGGKKYIGELLKLQDIRIPAPGKLQGSFDVRRVLEEKSIKDIAHEEDKRFFEQIGKSEIATHQCLKNYVAGDGDLNPEALKGRLPLGVAPEQALKTLEEYDIKKQVKAKDFANAYLGEFFTLDGKPNKNGDVFAKDHMLDAFRYGLRAGEGTIKTLKVDNGVQVGKPVWINQDGTLRSYPPAGPGVTIYKIGTVSRVHADGETADVVLAPVVVGVNPDQKFPPVNEALRQEIDKFRRSQHLIQPQPAAVTPEDAENMREERKKQKRLLSKL